jgi:hypothetical protein
MMLTLLLLLAALPPEHVVRQDDARVTWRENMCAGFKADDCSVRQPMTATVRVYFDGRDVPVLLWVRCKAKACAADRYEIGEWIERARRAK